MSAEPVDQEQTAVRRLLTENQRLKQRVFELEEKMRKGAPQGEGQSGTGSAVLKLIEHKDFQLQQATARLEEKKEQLAESALELEKRTAELLKWAESIRFYQDIFDNDPSVMIGVNRDARVILFNRTAAHVLGEKFKPALHQSIDVVDFGAFDPSTPRRVREALSSRKPVESSVTVRDRRILTSVTPIGSEAEPRGALLRIQILPAK